MMACMQIKAILGTDASLTTMDNYARYQLQERPSLYTYSHIEWLDSCKGLPHVDGRPGAMSVLA